MAAAGLARGETRQRESLLRASLTDERLSQKHQP